MDLCEVDGTGDSVSEQLWSEFFVTRLLMNQR
jgi:hypothetical protein